MAGRKIDKAAANLFQLGFSGDTGDWKTSGKLVIPYLTPAGPWFLKFRCIRCAGECEGHPKYFYEDEGAELHLFNAQALIGAKTVIVVEGEMDAIVVQGNTGVPTVAIPGSEAWTGNRHWRLLFDSAERVIIVGDGDLAKPGPNGKPREPGKELARQIAKDLRNEHPTTEIRTVVLPLGKEPDGSPKKTDSNSFICDQGVAAYKELIKL